jgi:hypothetical protein
MDLNKAFLVPDSYMIQQRERNSNNINVDVIEKIYHREHP